MARTRFRDDDGRLRAVEATGHNRSAAQRLLKEKLAKRDSRTGAPGELTADTPFPELVNIWLEDLELEDRLARNTRDLYARNIRDLVLPAFENFTLREISVSKVDRFLKAQVRISFSRAQQSKNVLSQALNLGPKPDGQLEAIIDVMLGTSARIGEVLAIRKCDVNVTCDPATVRIAGTIVSPKGQPTHRQDHPKTAKSCRTVAVPTFTAEALRRRLAVLGGAECASLIWACVIPPRRDAYARWPRRDAYARWPRRRRVFCGVWSNSCRGHAVSGRIVVMEIVVVAALVALLIWALVRSGRNRTESAKARRPEGRSPGSQGASLFEDESQFRVEIDSSVQRDFGRSSVTPELRRVERKAPADHLPPTPNGHGDEAWSPRTQELEVAGEWYRAENLRALFARHARISESGSEIRLPAVLVPDPANPHDDKAVAVFVDGFHVGYMEREDAQRYHRHIAGLPDGELVVTSRQWLRASSEDTWARVTISLPLPEHLQCPNPFEHDCVSLPPGSTIQVTKEEHYMEHLVGLLDRYGSDTVIAASLRSITEQRPRSSVDLVAVDIDGHQVGVLTTTQTANLMPLVRRADAEGRQIYCRASLRGNTLKADVALHARKAHEFDEAELQKLYATPSA